MEIAIPIEVCEDHMRSSTVEALYSAEGIKCQPTTVVVETQLWILGKEYGSYNTMI